MKAARSAAPARLGAGLALILSTAGPLPTAGAATPNAPTPAAPPTATPVTRAPPALAPHGGAPPALAPHGGATPAQPIPDADLAAPPVTLPALLAELEARSPLLRSRRASTRAAAARPAQARAFEDPMFMTELWQVPTDLHQVPLMLTLRQPLPWPSKLRARAAVLAAEEPLGQAALAGARRELRLELHRAYYAYRFASRAQAVLQQGRGLLADAILAAEARYRVGKAELTELLRAQEEAARLDDTLIDVATQQGLAQTALNSLLDRPADGPLGPPLSAPPAPDEALADPAQALAALTAQALRARPELAQSRARRDQAQARVRAAQAERAPDLAVWAGYMAQLRGGEGAVTLGVQTSLPTFSLARSRAAAREAGALLDVEDAETRRAQAQIRGEVREALLRLSSATKHLRRHRDVFIPLAERSIAAARISYASGRGDLSALLSAARGLIEHRLEFERYHADYGSRLAELEAALGGPLPDALTGEARP